MTGPRHPLGCRAPRLGGGYATLCDPTAAHAVLAGDKPADAFFIDPLTGGVS